MGSPDTPLRFAAPPIIELALSVQFSKPRIPSGFAGRLWASLGIKNYPKSEEQAPLPHLIESYGVPPQQETESTDDGGVFAQPGIRSWLISEDDTQLIQLQPDRLIVNWRRANVTDEYPHFDRMRSLFARVYSVLESIAEESRVGALVPDQVEITYVDHIETGGVWNRFGEVDRIFALWNPLTQLPNLGSLDGMRTVFQFVMRDSGQAPIGRLRLDIQTAYRRRDEQPVVQLNMTGRGAPMGNGLHGVLAFVDRAHQEIIAAFTQVTSAAIQNEWNKEKADGSGTAVGKTTEGTTGVV